MVKFLVHDKVDSVGVAVADIKAGETVKGYIMEEGTEIEVVSKSDILLGHKIALKDVAQGDNIIKYNVPIGITTQDITVGEHVHIHNLKTARW
ncbi:MAG: hypothetical protein FH758_15660 [Firmicutes bacterium]|nr:hypothetical protein [Bacillota bacterium]